MILELKHPTLGPIGTVKLLNGKVDGLVHFSASGTNPSVIRQMKGWIENSVRVYAAANNWVVTDKTNAPNS